MKNTILAMLEENARRFPGKIALADEFRGLTYRDYLRKAVRIAQKVREITGGCDEAGTDPVRCRPVGVLIDRSILSVTAFIGIAYSGNFYVPLDPALPGGRLEMILRELSPVMLVDAREQAGPLPVACKLPVMDIHEVWEGQEGAGEDPEDGQKLLADAKALRSGLVDTDPLYAIFTSGSTGIPKGVLVAHRSVLDLTESFGEVFEFDEDSVFGNQAPFDFDVSVKDIYNAIHCGGRVEVVPHRMFVMPAMLMEYLAVRGINTIIWAVSALRIVSDLRALDQMETSVPVRLRYIMFSGEVMPVKSINYWIRFFPDTIYVNLYGPTEITCNCTYHILDRHYGNEELLPIGRAFPNKRVFLLETEAALGQDDTAEGSADIAGGAGEEQIEEGRYIPRIIPVSEPGRRGEICVEGTGVSLGYWNNPARTSESFTAKPGMPATLNRIYRTGDLGYYNNEGELMFAARADNQIKHMGHRIELGEIEASLNAIDFIDVGCCFYDQKKEKIICVYQAESDRRKEIISALSVRLPKYMRPNKYLRLQQMPLNAHAKIDRKLLRRMYDEGTLR